MTHPAAPQDVPMSLRLGVLLSFVGGFLDAYTYLGRGGVFAGAQTGNLVLMAAFAAQGDWGRALRHVPSILAFAVGVAAASMLKRPSVIRRPALVVIAAETIVLVAMGLVPRHALDVLVTTVISFAAGLQLAVFSKLGPWGYNSTMMTGDLRNLVEAALGAMLDRDPDARTKLVDFAAGVAAFVIGAAIGGLMTITFHDPAIWAAAVVLCGALFSREVLASRVFL